MPAPYDYSGALSPVNPAQAIMSGLATGQKFAQVQQQEQQRRQLAETEAQFGREFEAAVDSRDPLAVAGLLGRFPGKAEILQKISNQFTKEERDQKLVQGMKLLGLSISGKPESIQNHYTELADLYEQSGNTESADLARKQLAVFEEDPDLWRGNQSLVMAAGMGADQFASTYKTLQETVRESVKANVERAKQKSPNRIALRELGIVGTPLKPTDADKFSNGLTMYRTDLGEQYGIDVSNNILQGKDYSTKLAEARDFEAATVGQTASARRRGTLEVEAELSPEIAAMVARATKGGEISQVMARDSYNTLGKVRLNIGNLEAAIAAVDAGADTGFIESNFPDWRASSIELRNIQRQLGLDVIGSVTFGALSAEELKLALETAIPINLQPAELKDWLQRKREYQLRMSSELEKATMFFSGGGTLGDYVKLQKAYKVPSGAQKPMGTSQNRDAVLSEMDAILGIN